MVRNSNFVKNAMAFAVVLAFGAVTTAQASDHACSNATLDGAYSALLGGTIAGMPFVTLDLVKADGEGNLMGTGTSNLNGTVSSTTIVATYIINPDCSGVATFTMPSAQTQNLNVKRDGSTIDITRAGPPSTGTLVSGTAHRIY